MTGAELRTVRDSLGLSAREVAEMCGVKERTVQRWEVDDWPVPQDVGSVIRQLDEEMELVVAEMVELLHLQIERAGRPPTDTVLLRYRSAEDLARFQPGWGQFPPAVHGALVDRVRLAFARLGVESRIVWMEASAYEAWRGKRRDSEALRSQWAAEQIAPPK